jgi:chromosome segregation protein
MFACKGDIIFHFRMYLKSIELSGFKSFGKKARLSSLLLYLLLLVQRIRKSNVAESFRFVLGEQSIKSLRGKRAEDLIFNGGKDAPRANRASVKLVFDNTRRIFILILMKYLSSVL